MWMVVVRATIASMSITPCVKVSRIDPSFFREGYGWSGTSMSGSKETRLFPRLSMGGGTGP